MIILEPQFDRTFPKFDISGSIHVTKDFANTKPIELKVTDFTIKKPGT
jgi:hypothetical protein